MSKHNFHVRIKGQTTSQVRHYKFLIKMYIFIQRHSNYFYNKELTVFDNNKPAVDMHWHEIIEMLNEGVTEATTRKRLFAKRDGMVDWKIQVKEAKHSDFTVDYDDIHYVIRVHGNDRKRVKVFVPFIDATGGWKPNLEYATIYDQTFASSHEALFTSRRFQSNPHLLKEQNIKLHGADGEAVIRRIAGEVQDYLAKQK